MSFTLYAVTLQTFGIALVKWFLEYTRDIERDESVEYWMIFLNSILLMLCECNVPVKIKSNRKSHGQIKKLFV